MFRKRLSRKDFKACRLCLGSDGMLMYLFEASGVLTNVARAISEVLQYKVSEDDRFPKYVCSACSDKLWEFKVFKEKCDCSKETFETFLSKREKHLTKYEDPLSVNTVFVKEELPSEMPSGKSSVSREGVPVKKNAKGTKRKFKVFVESVTVEANDVPEKSNQEGEKLRNERLTKAKNVPIKLKEELGLFCTEEDRGVDESEENPVLSNLRFPADIVKEEITTDPINNFQVFAESIAVEDVADQEKNEGRDEKYDNDCCDEITVSPVKMEIGGIQVEDKGEIFPVKLGLYPAPVISEDRIVKLQGVGEEVKDEASSRCDRPEKLTHLPRKLPPTSETPMFSSETANLSSGSESPSLTSQLSLCPSTGNFISSDVGAEINPNGMLSEETAASRKDSILMKLLSTAEKNDEESSQDVAANLQEITRISQASNSGTGVVYDLNGQCSKSITNPAASAQEANGPTVQNSILMQLLLIGRKEC